MPIIDLTALLEAKTRIKNRDEVLAARALALLLLGRGPEAVADATEAQRLRPSPAHERLRQRALLARAAGRTACSLTGRKTCCSCPWAGDD